MVWGLVQSLNNLLEDPGSSSLSLLQSSELCSKQPPNWPLTVPTFWYLYPSHLLPGLVCVPLASVKCRGGGVCEYGRRTEIKL